MGAPTNDVARSVAREHLEELSRLAYTAGAEVTGTLTQRLDAPHPKYYIGKGKAKQLRSRIEEEDANLVLFDEELTPAQGTNLENAIGARVMDRTELILDIFVTRARTNEAQMQVELAQLQYMLPRLKRMWTHLSRTRGGIGLRGPGEKQIETDRRIIGRQIRDLRQKLEVVARRRATQRKGRSGEFRVALVGYTNAGKSSLLRALSGADLFVEDRLFATLDSVTRSVGLGDAGEALVTDTVGFIRKLPHHLVASFRATLEEARDADVLLHVIDASHPGWEEQKRVVEDVLADMELGGRPAVPVFNKMDQLTHAEEEGLRARVDSRCDPPVAFSSAVEPDGLDEVRERLRDAIRARRPEVHLLVPVIDGEALATIYREGEVIARDDNDTTIDLVAHLPQPALGRLRQRGGIEITGAA